MTQPQLETRTLAELFGLTDDKVKNVAFPVNVNPGPMTPHIEPAYQFQQDHVRRLLLWIGGVAGRNLLITGPTGCGKSSLIEQLCARLGRELYRVPCHGKLEFSELTGQLTVLPDGSTKFVHGPLPRAMQTGSVLLLDEMNFIHPSAIGALNTVLDGGPLLIPETGELIAPHDDFRIVATGNALDHGDDSSLYRGTQRMNLALIQRFLTLKADYLSPTDEAAMLNRTVPGVPGNVIGILAQVAGDVREAFKKGDIESTVSTRTLVKWARVLQARVPVLVAQPEDELKFSLQFVLTDGLKPEDAKAIEGVLQRYSSGIVVKMPAGAANAPASSAGRASSRTRPAQAQRQTATVTKTTMHFLVNPNRDGNGSATFWVGVEPSAGQLGMSLNGSLTPQLTVRVVNDKDQAWISQTCSEKRNTRGYRLSHIVTVPVDQAEDVAREAATALNIALVSKPVTVKCKSAITQALAQEIAKQMGITSTSFSI